VGKPTLNPSDGVFTFSVGHQRIGNQQDRTRVGDLMKRASCVAGVAFLACSIAGFAETKIPCSQSFDHALESRAVLLIDSRPAGLHIVGTDKDAIHVSCTAGSEENAMEVSFHFSPTAKGGKLSIEGAHLHNGNNNIEVRIEIPRRTSVSIRMMAGEVRLEAVKGDKDIDIGAGQVTISSIHEGEYRSVDTSVGVGEVKASAFGADKGGFFRTFKKENSSGDYRLRAHVTTGQIELLGNAVEKGEGARSD